MTYRQFLKALRKTPRQWTISIGRIRLMPDFSPLTQCPITAVCTALQGTQLIAGDWEQAAALIGLNERVAKRIMESGNGGTPSYGFYSEEVRRDLLRATVVARK